LGPALPQANCVTRFPMPGNCRLCKANGILLTMQERGRCQHPAYSATLRNSTALPKHHPWGALEKKGNIVASILQKEKLREDTQERHQNSGQTHQAFWLADTFRGSTPSPTRCWCFHRRERGSYTSALERHLPFSEVACLLSLRIGRDRRYFELKKALLFPCATPSSSPCRPVSLSHTHTFLPRLPCLLNAAQYRNSSSA